jgi:hypothetical protein
VEWGSAPCGKKLPFFGARHSTFLTWRDKNSGSHRVGHESCENWKNTLRFWFVLVYEFLTRGMNIEYIPRFITRLLRSLWTWFADYELVQAEASTGGTQLLRPKSYLPLGYKISLLEKFPTTSLSQMTYYSLTHRFNFTGIRLSSFIYRTLIRQPLHHFDGIASAPASRRAAQCSF